MLEMNTHIVLIVIMSIGIAELSSVCEEPYASRTNISNCVHLVGTKCSTNEDCAQSFNVTCTENECKG